MLTRWAIACCLLLAICGSVRASFILRNCPEGALLGAKAMSGYHGPGGCKEDCGSDAADCRADPCLIPASSTMAYHMQRPAFSSSVRDKVDLRALPRLAFGSPAGPAEIDTVKFLIFGTASATDSCNRAGNLAAARATGRNSFCFDTSPAGLPDTRVGTLEVGSLRKTLPYETLLRVDVFRDGVLAQTSLPGSRAYTMPLYNNSAYRVRLAYTIVVPPRTDPRFRVTHRTRLIPIPEPSACVTILLGLVTLAWRRPRH